MTNISRFHRIYKFDNGATLIYYKHNLNNTTQFEVGFLGGANLDVIPGTAHFLEHMLVKRTENMTAEEIALKLRDWNINCNAFTSNQFIKLYCDTPNTNLDKAIDLYKEFLFNKYFDEKDMKLERMAIDEEINMYEPEQNVDLTSRSISFLNEAFAMIAYTNQEEISICGTHDSIAKIRSNDLLQFIQNNFVSENMIIAVSSNLEFDEIKEKFENAFVKNCVSDVTKKYKYEKTKYYPPSNYLYRIRDNNQKTVEIDIAYLTRRKAKEAHLFSYIENFIFNSFSGKLHSEIREKRGLVYGTYYAPYILPNNTCLNTFVALTSKDKVNETIDTIGKIIEKVSRDGITQEELDACKNMILVEEKDRRNGLKTMKPSTLLDRYLEGDEVFFNNQIHSVKELTLDQVNKYLRDTYTNTNIIAMIKGDFDDNCYSTYKIQKVLNARLSQIYISKTKYYDYETNQELSERKAMQKVSGLTTIQKFSNIAFVEERDIKEENKAHKNIEFIYKSVDEKIAIIKNYCDLCGIDLGINDDIKLKIEEYTKQLKKYIAQPEENNEIVFVFDPDTKDEDEEEQCGEDEQDEFGKN